MTFDELFSEHHLTAEEREQLAHHLASMRYRNTVNAIMKPQPAPLNPLDVLRVKQKEA